MNSQDYLSSVLTEDFELQKLGPLHCSFRHFEQRRMIWAFETQKLFQALQYHIEDLDQQAQQPKTLKMIRKRLQALASSNQEHLKAMENVLAPLKTIGMDAQQFFSYVAQTNPNSMMIEHYSNLFRDWAWGDRENQTSLELIKKVVQNGEDLGNVLVLGSGASRLAYDIHREFSPNSTLCVDNNPFPFLVAQRVISGESLELFDFPRVPTSGQSFAIERTLSAPEKIEHDFYFLLTDLKDWCFKEHAFDTIITPWFTDVFPVDLAVSNLTFNNVLKPGGRWIQFGPLHFDKMSLSQYYTKDEVLYLAEKAGFEVQKTDFRKIPYLHNPESSVHREEQILAFSALKTEHKERVDFEEGGIHLPEWLEDINRPVNLPQEILNLKGAYDIGSKIFALVDGKRSIEDITQEVSSEIQVPIEDLRNLVFGFLIENFQKARINPMGGAT